MKTRISKTASGFTLVELMVAMAITTIMVTVLISITSISLNTWNRSRAELRAARQAQAMTEIMARDFEAMVVRPGNNFEWLFAKSSDTVGPASNASPNSADIILFTAATDRYDGQIGTAQDLGGDISAVRYLLNYNNPMDPSEANSPFSTFVLTRRLINPNETFDSLLARDDLEAALATLAAPTSEDTKTYFVCENIYQFSLTLHFETSEPQKSVTLVQSSDSEIRLFGDRVELDGTAMASDTKITAVEVSLTVLSDNAVNALRGNVGNLDDFIKKNSFQYSKLIQVPRL